MSYVCFVSYKQGTMSDIGLPHLFTRISISGNVFDGWTRPGNGFPDKHMFISLDRIESLEFWEVVPSFGQPDENKKEGVVQNAEAHGKN